MGYEGFSGNETILYHLNSPCRLDSVGNSAPSCATSGYRRRTCTGWPTRSRSWPAAIR